MFKTLLSFILLLTSQVLWAEDKTFVLDGKDVLVPGVGSKSTLTEHSKLQGFIKDTFNKPGPYFGPNCYNTALNAVNFFSKKNVRYTSPEEFEEILKVSFEEVAHPESQDLVVFDALSSRGHVGFYLGDNLVFHKKSFGTYYTYRIVEISTVGAYEENEWKPSVFEDSSSQMVWPNLGKLPMKFYRFTKTQRPELDTKLAPFISKIERLLLDDLSSWSIAKKWGMAGEIFLEEMLPLAKGMKANSYTQAVLLSLKDQVYIMLEEVNFKKARSPERVLQELCVPEKKEQLFSLIKELGTLLGKDTQQVEFILNSIETQDKQICSFKPLKTLLAM